MFPVWDYANTNLAIAYIRYTDYQNRSTRADSKQIPLNMARRAAQLLCSGIVQQKTNSLQLPSLQRGKDGDVLYHPYYFYSYSRDTSQTNKK